MVYQDKPGYNQATKGACHLIPYRRVAANMRQTTATAASTAIVS